MKNFHTASFLSIDFSQTISQNIQTCGFRGQFSIDADTRAMIEAMACQRKMRRRFELH